MTFERFLFMLLMFQLFYYDGLANISLNLNERIRLFPEGAELMIHL
ncbi:hypothetical protein [Alkalihalobacillus sp. LMS39]|nr:hypothetical protein [Alkalihalobacillus sp. LMS39]UOE94084.1 hypothetical protein MM271_23405 [Alkalihalobacillus sp. LMS39]